MRIDKASAPSCCVHLRDKTLDIARVLDFALNNVRTALARNKNNYALTSVPGAIMISDLGKHAHLHPIHALRGISTNIYAYDRH
jgi:hypothetical protein